jgi:hypothetical protein
MKHSNPFNLDILLFYLCSIHLYKSRLLLFYTRERASRNAVEIWERTDRCTHLTGDAACLLPFLLPPGVMFLFAAGLWWDSNGGAVAL